MSSEHTSRLCDNTAILCPGLQTLSDVMIGFVHSAMVSSGRYQLHAEFASSHPSVLKPGWNENPNITLLKYTSPGDIGVTLKFAKLSNQTIEMNIRFTGPSAPTRSTTISLRPAPGAPAFYSPSTSIETLLPNAAQILEQLSSSPLQLAISEPIAVISVLSSSQPIDNTTTQKQQHTPSVTISRDMPQPPPLCTPPPIATASDIAWKPLTTPISDFTSAPTVPSVQPFPPQSSSSSSMHTSFTPASTDITLRSANAREAAGVSTVAVQHLSSSTSNASSSITSPSIVSPSSSCPPLPSAPGADSRPDDNNRDGYGVFSRHPAPPGALGGYGGHELVGPDQLLPRGVNGPGIFRDDDDNFYNGGYRGGPSGPGFFGPHAGNPLAPGIPGFPGMQPFADGRGGPSGPGFPALPGNGKEQPKFPKPRFDPFGPFSGMGEPDNDQEKKRGRGFGPGGMF